MCGIGVVVGVTVGSGGGAQLENVLKRRGPDYAQGVQLSPTLSVQATVLHMRGPSLVPQPVSLKNGVFCWNGEVYEMDEEEINSVSDTNILSAMLDEKECATLQDIAAVMGRVSNGEFAFCVVNETSVFYGRDQWGRRSLLVSESKDTWRLSSVALGSLKQSWTEVPPGRVYQYNLETGETNSLPLVLSTAMLNLPPCTTSMGKPSHVSQSMWDASLQLQQHLVRAVQRRCCCSYRTEGVGILFSGGLDSVVLTALAAELVPPSLPLDLLNVSFDDNSADRQAALQSHAELQTLYPNHTFRLVCIQADWDQIAEQQERIERLMHPKTTTMDLNISTALWFAVQGKGTLLDGQPYHSTCRILLLGMGADEQMAGYGRHRKCIQNGAGYSRLRQELDMDMGRLWERNLGRDDRLVSDHGKEARFPYLDTHVINFLSSIELQNVCDFSQEPGIGDKQILRLIAQRLGLTTASGLVKRAIQFGSRIAHVSDKRRFGSRRKATGTSHYKASADTPR